MPHSYQNGDQEVKTVYVLPLLSRTYQSSDLNYQGHGGELESEVKTTHPRFSTAKTDTTKFMY